MKHTVRSTHMLILVLAIFFSLACGAASQAVATSAPVEKAAPTAAVEPTAAPTEAATEAPVALADISGARIFLSDLPEGFEELPSEDLNEGGQVPGEDGIQPGLIFGFVNPGDFQMVVGMNFLLTGGLDQLGFGLVLSQQEAMLKEFVSAMGTNNVRDEKVLEGFEDIGESQVAMTMFADVEGIPMQVDVIMLQRDAIGGMVLSMNMEGKTPGISLHELGTAFDKHIQETLETLP